MTITNWNIEEMTGYKPITTFYEDLSIADAFGEEGIRDTYDRVMCEEGWLGSVEFVTEFVMALNWKSWEHYGRGNTKLCELYTELYEKADAWCMDNFTGDDLTYYLRTTD